MKPTALLTAAALGLALASPLGAHPHIYIDTDFDLVFDTDGKLAAVRIDWAYDDFYSLLMIEENGLDADGDGTPEQARLDAFAGQDADWEAGFPGHFTLDAAGTPLALGPPEEHRVRYEDGRIITSHLRPLVARFEIDAAPLVARSYDPTYFVAYDVPETPGSQGRDDCSLTRNVASRDAAMKEYGDQLAAVDASDDPFQVVDLPDIGILFADSFEITCNAPS